MAYAKRTTNINLPKGGPKGLRHLPDLKPRTSASEDGGGNDLGGSYPTLDKLGISARPDGSVGDPYDSAQRAAVVEGKYDFHREFAVSGMFSHSFSLA
jgi:hypothetical protein